MDLLFDLLASDNSAFVGDVWDLLQLLPVNKNIRSKIEKFEIDAQSGWYKNFDDKCYRKLLYCL